jgi:hypothetical protein
MDSICSCPHSLHGGHGRWLWSKIIGGLRTDLFDQIDSAARDFVLQSGGQVIDVSGRNVHGHGIEKWRWAGGSCPAPRAEPHDGRFGGIKLGV